MSDAAQMGRRDSNNITCVGVAPCPATGKKRKGRKKDEGGRKKIRKSTPICRASVFLFSLIVLYG